ncbi:hypothetical protein [Nocardioides sp. SYSU DS0651]|uniref:hypothetical protein n=1 Tax=Nocardioides sp. SYSU DS0651 TaxID=3415955 RepID=UPI003F4C5883
MSRPHARRPASSRGATPRPRKIAGQSPGARSEVADAPDELRGDESSDAPATESSDRLGLGKAARAARSAEPSPPLLSSPRVTRVLIAVLAALALVLAAQAVWWLVGEEAEPAVARDPGRVAVPEDLPVVASELAVLEGVDAAAKAAEEIVAVDHAKYDDEVDAAAALMTADFEEQYRETARDIEKQLVDQQTKVQVNVVAQGVVRANRTELEALIFLNQVVERVRDKEPETVVTPFKVLVTMVHTDQGWLVDDLETDASAEDNGE